MSRTDTGTVAAAWTTDAGAGATGGGTTAVVPRVTLTTRRTTTITRTRTTNAHVTRAIGARRTGTATAGPSFGALPGVDVIVEGSPVGVMETVGNGRKRSPHRWVRTEPGAYWPIHCR